MHEWIATIFIKTKICLQKVQFILIIVYITDNLFGKIAASFGNLEKVHYYEFLIEIIITNFFQRIWYEKRLIIGLNKSCLYGLQLLFLLTWTIG